VASGDAAPGRTGPGGRRGRPRAGRRPAEAAAVADLYRTSPLVHPDAAVASVTAALSGAALVHFATHGRLSAENPLFSHLLLSDGPLVAYDLERLPVLPHTVVLAACESGRNVVRAGDELLGLSAVFLARGPLSSSRPSCRCPTPRPRRSCARSTRACPPASVGRGPGAAQVEAFEAGPAAAAAAAGFVCSDRDSSRCRGTRAEAVRPERIVTLPVEAVSLPDRPAGWTSPAR